MPTGLLVTNGSKMRSRIAGYAAAIVHDVNDDAVEMTRRGDRTCPDSGDGVDGVVDQVRPHLIEIAANGADEWQAPAPTSTVMPTDFLRALCCSSVDGIVQACDHVERSGIWARSMYENRFTAPTSLEIRDAARSTSDASARVVQPAATQRSATVSTRRRASAARPSRPWIVTAVSASDDASFAIRAVAVEPCGDFVFTVGAFDRRERGSQRDRAGTCAVVDRCELRVGQPRRAKRLRRFLGNAERLGEQPGAARAADAGLFSSCARPAASLPSDSIFSSCSSLDRNCAGAIEHHVHQRSW